jgi:hypothetical protein
MQCKKRVWGLNERGNTEYGTKRRLSLFLQRKESQEKTCQTARW